LKSVVVPLTVQTFGPGCFMGCAALTYVSFHGPAHGEDALRSGSSSRLRVISDSVFADRGLKMIAIPVSLSSVDAHAFPPDCVIRVIGCELAPLQLPWTNGLVVPKKTRWLLRTQPRGRQSTRSSNIDDWKRNFSALPPLWEIPGGVRLRVQLVDGGEYTLGRGLSREDLRLRVRGN
jgi:hypothetical protein